MSTAITNKVAFLRTSRNFPEDLKQLTIEVNKSYLDIAGAVNDRVIGIFPTTQSAVTGESWFTAGANKKQQGVRQVYQFTSAGNIVHGINLATIVGFIKIYGTFTDGTNWYPLPYVDVTAATNQVAITITPMNIVITTGSGAPAITGGFLVLEWLSQT